MSSTHKSSRRGFAQPALPGWIPKLIVVIILAVIVMMLWGSIAALSNKLLSHNAKPKPTPAATAPPRVAIGNGGAPQLFHGQQTLVIAPGSTGCIRPAPGDTQLSATVHNTIRTKNKVKIIKECDFGDGIQDDSPSGKFNNVATYSFRVVNNSPEPVIVSTWSW